MSLLCVKLLSGQRSRWLAAAVSALFMVLPVSNAEAQGLFELLFGKPKSASSADNLAVPPPQQRGAAHSSPQKSLSRQQDADGEPSESRGSGGTYKTVCVRMCDGSFTPVSFATTKSHFGQDQAKCTASCGAEARLFYFRNPGAGMEDAVDVQGRAYNKLPNAFKFRKTLVEGCACRPAPWSEAELARHRRYAAAEQLALSPTASNVTVPTERVVQVPESKPAAKPTSPPTSQPAAESVGQLAQQSVPVAAKPSSLPSGKGTAAASDQAKAPADTSPSSKLRPPVRVTADMSKPAKPVTPINMPAKPVAIAATPLPKPAPGVFGGLGGGNGSGMGLSGQPKYRWPGD